MNKDILRHVRLEMGYTLKIWDTGRMKDNRQVIGYEFKDSQGNIIFKAEDFYPSPFSSIDSDESLKCLLSFLTLRPGDVEEDYFKDYNEIQMSFAKGYAELLQIYADEESEAVFEDLED